MAFLPLALPPSSGDSIAKNIVQTTVLINRQYYCFHIIYYHRIRPGPRLLEHFRNKFIFYGEELLAPTPSWRTTPCRLSATAYSIWRASPPSATWGRAMPWWQGTHLTLPYIYSSYISLRHQYSLLEVQYNMPQLSAPHPQEDTYSTDSKAWLTLTGLHSSTWQSALVRNCHPPSFFILSDLRTLHLTAESWISCGSQNKQWLYA
jgi:hypothetical protein